MNDTRSGNQISKYTFHCIDADGNQWTEKHSGTSWETAARLMIRKWKRYQVRAKFLYDGGPR